MLKFRSKKKKVFPKFSIIIWILTLCTLILSLYYQQQKILNQLFAIIPVNLIDNVNQSWWYVYRLFSAVFLHGSWQHWAGNMILFLIIALPLEKRVGGLWFLLIYFSSGFIANISCLYQLSNSDHYLLGASGAVSGLLGAWLMLFPYQKISIIIPIGLYFHKTKIPIAMLAGLWLSIQIILQLINSQNNSIVWSAHIVGFIVGFFVAWLYRIIR